MSNSTEQQNSSHSLFAFLQKLGKSLMLPVSILPIAGLLLGLGSLPNSVAKNGDWITQEQLFQIIPEVVFTVMQSAGSAIFANLALIIAMGVALGLSNNRGSTTIAAAVGYFTMLTTIGVIAATRGIELKSINGIETLDTGVFGGLLAGVLAAYLANRYKDIKLPSYLGFFSGERFVPIVTGLSAILLGIIMAYIWPPAQQWIKEFSTAAAYTNPTLSAFVYGLVERALLPFGLHHVWNFPFFFEIGSFTSPNGIVFHGEIPRFMNGDPTAGILGGGYLFKMFGLPAAALAMVHCAKPEFKAQVSGVMGSAALTSFLTGITEPIEFAFLFTAPALYAVHAFLAGSCFMVMQQMGGLLGYSFSHGFIDYVLFYPMDTKPWLVFSLGPLYALVYYFLFRTLITRFDLATPGRTEESVSATNLDLQELALAVTQALGGPDNIKSLDSCITRLRVELYNPKQVQEGKLKDLGATAVIQLGSGLQAIFGTQSEAIKNAILQQQTDTPTNTSASIETKNPQLTSSTKKLQEQLGDSFKVRGQAYSRLIITGPLEQLPQNWQQGLSVLGTHTIDPTTMHVVLYPGKQI